VALGIGLSFNLKDGIAVHEMLAGAPLASEVAWAGKYQ
jgi:hypothetical protein